MQNPVYSHSVTMASEMDCIISNIYLSEAASVRFCMAPDNTRLIKIKVKLDLRFRHRWVCRERATVFLLGLLLDHEDGGDMSL
jgi:hypothetical protein